MAKNKKWNKVIARIQALENALAGLLSGKPRKTKKAKKAKSPPARAKAKSKSGKSTTKRAKTKTGALPARKSKPRKKNLRVAVAEAAPILPQPPIPAL